MGRLATVRRWKHSEKKWFGFGNRRLEGAVKEAESLGSNWTDRRINGYPILIFINPTLPNAYALLPETRAECGNSARLDPVRGATRKNCPYLDSIMNI